MSGRKQESPQKGGGAWLVLATSFAALGLGAALDISAGGAGRFWLLAEPGVRATLGAGAAIAAALAGHAARLVLRAPGEDREKGKRDARGHP